MLKNTVIVLALIFLSDSAPLWATNEGAGDPWAFMTIGMGARATGLGGAFVAVADDATANYWNPAGIGFIRNHQATFMKVTPNEKSSDMTADGIAGNHDYISGVLKTAKWGSFGGSYNGFSIDGIQYTIRLTDEDFDYIGEGDDRESALTFSYAYPFSFPTNTEWLSVGISGKYLTQQFFGFQTNAWRIDVGYLMHLRQVWFFDNIRLAGVFQTTPEHTWEEAADRSDFEIKAVETFDNKGASTTKPADEPLFPAWRGGMALDKAITNQVTGTLAFSLTNRRKGSPLFLSVGTEIWFDNRLALRVGVDDIRPLKRKATVAAKPRLTLGGGIRLSHFQFDYSFSSEALSVKHRWSLTITR